jgi:hypothetical protein
MMRKKEQQVNKRKLEKERRNKMRCEEDGNRRREEG